MVFFGYLAEERLEWSLSSFLKNYLDLELDEKFLSSKPNLATFKYPVEEVRRAWESNRYQRLRDIVRRGEKSQ